MATINFEPKSLLEIIAKGFDAFNHAIRSPLSVISNDLAYWEKTLTKSETDRGKAAIQKISGMMESMEAVLKPLGLLEERSLSQIFRELRGVGAQLGTQRISVDVVRINEAIAFAENFLQISAWDIVNEGNVFHVEGRSNRKDFVGTDASTLTECIYKKLGGLQVLQALNFDLTLYAHGWKAILFEDRIQIRFQRH